MLTLSRKVGEEIVILPDITIKVIEILGNRVRIGISAPSHVRILRQEVYLRIQDEKQVNEGEANT